MRTFTEAEVEKIVAAARRHEREEAERAFFLECQRDALDRDDGRDDFYIPGCGADDTRDSKGRKLLPRVNEGGEPCWM